MSDVPAGFPGRAGGVGSTVASPLDGGPTSRGEAITIEPRELERYIAAVTGASEPSVAEHPLLADLFPLVLPIWSVPGSRGFPPDGASNAMLPVEVDRVGALLALGQDTRLHRRPDAGCRLRRTQAVVRDDTKHGRSGAFRLVEVERAVLVDAGGGEARVATQRESYAVRSAEPSRAQEHDAQAAAVDRGDLGPIATTRVFSAVDLALYSAATWNPHLIHLDDAAGRAEGLPGAVVHSHLLPAVIVAWVDPDAVRDDLRLGAVRWRNRAPVPRGVAVDFRVAGDGRRTAWSAVVDGAVVADGSIELVPTTQQEDLSS